MSKTMRNRQALPVSSVRCDDARKSTPPGQLVEQARQLVDQAQEILKLAVVAERMRGTSWDTIGAADGGSTKSATHKRYSHLVTQWQDESQTYRLMNDNDDPSIDVEASDFDVAYSELEQAWGDADDAMAGQKYLTLLRAMGVGLTAPKSPSERDEPDSTPSPDTTTIENQDRTPPGDDDGADDAVDHGIRRDTQDPFAIYHSTFESLVRKAAWRRIRHDGLGQPDFLTCHDGKLLMYELKHLHSEDGPLAATSAWLDYPYAKPKASVEERLTRLEGLFGAYLAEQTDDERER
ncbi:hypothetical protein [Streptomyces sp. NPDC047197]|uniref:hypothetical protein n=1 Tax=unclassified Streptomyces TaxID=2593676 RepID=UPI0033E80ADF